MRQIVVAFLALYTLQAMAAFDFVLAPAMSDNLFTRLGVDDDSSCSEVLKAYLKLRSQYLNSPSRNTDLFVNPEKRLNSEISVEAVSRVELYDPGTKAFAAIYQAYDILYLKKMCHHNGMLPKEFKVHTLWEYKGYKFRLEQQRPDAPTVKTLINLYEGELFELHGADPAMAMHIAIDKYRASGMHSEYATEFFIQKFLEERRSLEDLAHSTSNIYDLLWVLQYVKASDRVTVAKFKMKKLINMAESIALVNFIIERDREHNALSPATKTELLVDYIFRPIHDKRIPLATLVEEMHRLIDKHEHSTLAFHPFTDALSAIENLAESQNFNVQSRAALPPPAQEKPDNVIYAAFEISQSPAVICGKMFIHEPSQKGEVIRLRK